MSSPSGPRNRRLWGVAALFLAGFVGLCTLFASVVAAVQAWQETTCARWPELTAHVRHCELSIYTHKPESYYINCSVGYRVGSEELVSEVASRSTPAPRRVVWQPQPQFQMMQEWVNGHPQGTPISVHYDPLNPGRAVLVATDMPLGGPRTPDNLKLVKAGLAGCAVLLAIAWLARPRSAPAARS